MLLIIQGFTALCLLPLGICIILLAVLFGIEVYLFTLGSSVVGFALITLAVMGLLSAVSGLVWKLVGGSKRKFSSFGVRFLICAALFGAGAVVSVNDMATFQIEDSPLYAGSATTHSYVLEAPASLGSLSFPAASIEIMEDESIDLNQVLIHYTAPDLYEISELEQDGNSYTLYAWLNPTDEVESIQQIIKATFEGLKENIIYEYNELNALSVKIYVHPDTAKRITISNHEVIFQ